MSDISDQLLRELGDLSAEDHERVREYIAFLRWRREQGNRPSVMGAVHPWQYNLLEQFRSATIRASGSKAGMEVKAAEASVGGELRPAVWAHPPIRGEAQVEFAVPVPAGLRDLSLRFAVGIRDGSQPTEERLMAFRVRVGGWLIWSHAAWPRRWEPMEIALPLQAGDVLQLSFATDGLGDHEWAWAVWGEPELVGLEAGI
jgi:hypothetical protein